jgi:hypothetical protein
VVTTGGEVGGGFDVTGGVVEVVVFVEADLLHDKNVKIPKTKINFFI